MGSHYNNDDNNNGTRRRRPGFLRHYNGNKNKELLIAERLLLLLFVFMTMVVHCGSGASEDLYKILGVKRSATVKEIKRAYRRKALDTHPDKNPDVAPEVAAAEFHKVVQAFEILSDTSSRQRYDRTGRTDQDNNNQGFGGGGFGGGGFGGGFNFNFNFGGGGGRRQQYRPQKLKDKFEVKQAQSRVMHLASLEQLKTVMLDDDDLLERNLLMVFVTPQDVETLSDDEIVFPYPFAAKSSQGIWWEDLLQTAKVRFYRRHDIQEFLGVKDGHEIRKSGKPVFLFAKRGTKLEAKNFERLETNDRQTFEDWVWKRIEVTVEFINRHTHEVEVYWIHGTRANIKFNLKPGESTRHNTMLSHEWWVRDARVDRRADSPGKWKLTDESCLGTWKILSDKENQKLVIGPKTCYDLSGHCQFWKRQGECRKNPNFMAEVCQLTCKLCSKKEDDRIQAAIEEELKQQEELLQHPQESFNRNEQQQQQQQKQQEDDNDSYHRRRQEREERERNEREEEQRRQRERQQRQEQKIKQRQQKDRERQRQKQQQQEEQRYEFYLSCVVIFASTLLPMVLVSKISLGTFMPF